MLTLNWTMSVHHDGSPLYVTFVHDAHTSVRLRLRMAANAPVERIFVRTSPDGEQHMQPMHQIASDEVCSWWETTLHLPMLRTNYRFFLVTSEGGWWLTATGMMRYTPTDATDFKILRRYHAPHWVQESVFYQIFPERFADGDDTNNVRNGEYQCYGHSVVTRKWGESPKAESGEGGNAIFFGGDLQGITQHLDYIADLGANALYLTPIFTSPSNHKYDVANYKEVDIHFGGDEALIALRKALDERSMKLMLDIVPNHCSSQHPWFLAAQTDPQAATAEFFTLGATPGQYESWLGVRSLPKLNYRSEQLRNEMYAGNDAVMRHWLRPPYHIDGWRIDVANMLARQGESQLEHKIGRGLRRAVKEEAPHAYLIGENFFDGSPQLQGDELDATMNYRGFSLPLLHWLVGYDNAQGWNPQVADPFKLPTDALISQWKAFLAAIPWQIATQQFNLLGSHDTPRIETIVQGNEVVARIATTLLFTYPGVPSVYFGDEIGLAGGRDPDNRRCMPWNTQEWNQERRAFYQKLILERRTSPALRGGGLQHLYAAGDTLAYLREAAEERLLIVARRAHDGLDALPVDHGAIADRTSLTDILTGTEAQITNGQLSLTDLPAVGVQVWRIGR